MLMVNKDFSTKLTEINKTHNYRCNLKISCMLLNLHVIAF